MLKLVKPSREYLPAFLAVVEDYRADQNQFGRGIMTRALNKLTEMGVANMGLQRIQLTLDKQNIRSAAVALRCGYECGGVLRKYFVLRGQPRDMKIFAKVVE